MEKMQMRQIMYTLFAAGLVFLGACKGKQGPRPESLREALKECFLIGVAVNDSIAKGAAPSLADIVRQQFNSVVAENCMKSEVIQPEEGRFDFEKADRFVRFGEEHGMHIVGHTLIWHSQCPAWFFVDENGKEVTKEVLKERMRTHIQTLVGRYKGRIQGWDVVNEALLGDGSLRDSKFLEIIGEEYIQLAFQWAHEADPEAELYYNDYDMANPKKREGAVRLVRNLQEKGIRVDAIGMQGHAHIRDYPSLSDFEQSIEAFAQLGVKIMVTELDITVLPFPDKNIGAEVSASFEYQQSLNPYAGGLPEEIARELDQRYFDFFRLFLKHHDKISRVTLWGVSDGLSWRNYWPIEGRTDYPLLFDRSGQAKPAVGMIIREAQSINQTN